MEDLYHLAHEWEEQAEACGIVRRWNEQHDITDNLLIRQQVFESCAKRLRVVAGRVKESPKSK